MSHPRDLTAILLAAGRGSRIIETTQNPKILLPLAGRSLLDRHLDILAEAGVSRVIVVVGYRRETIERVAKAHSGGLDLRFVANADYVAYGNGYSLFLGLQEAPGEVLIFDGDLAYEAEILFRFIAEPKSSAVLVGSGSLEDIECSKALVDSEGWIRKTVDKRAITEVELNQFQFAGEAIGILKFSDLHRRSLLELGREFFGEKRNRPLNWEHYLTQFFMEESVWCHQEPSPNWIEIDTPEDYREAQRLFESGNK